MPRNQSTWHHVILTTYGAWLPGDPRGFRTRHHREHVDGDYHRPPPADAYDQRVRRSRSLLKQAEVVLPAPLRPIVAQSLHEKLVELGAQVLTLSVSGQHVHLQLRLPYSQARSWIGIAKKHTTFTLRNHAWTGRLWATRFKLLVIRDREHQQNVHRYILAHASTGACVRRWKITVE